MAIAATLLMGAWQTSVAQKTFVEGNKDIFFCDFQDVDKSYQLFSTYDFSGLQPSSFMRSLGFAKGRPWLFKLMDDQTSVNYFAGCCSEFDPAGQANAWLVTGRIDIPAKNCKLSWKSESLNASKLDGLKIFISTVGGNPETDFPENPVWESKAESAGESDRLDGEWNEHQISLDDYAGKSIWIAFVNQTNNGQVLCLDDVRVFFDGNYIVESALPRLAVGETIEVKGRLVVKKAAVKAYTVCCCSVDGKVLAQTYSGLDLQPSESHEFILNTPMILGEKGVYTPYQLWAEVEGDQSIGLTDSVARVSFVPTRRVVLEEGTGTWCGWCPQGILAIENLHTLYGDHVIPIAVHNADVMTVEAYNSGLGFSAFPMGVVNRQYGCYPMRNEGKDYFFEGAGTFLEAVEWAMAELQTVETTLSEAVLEEGTLRLTSETRFAIAPALANYRLAYVLMENDVTPAKTYQTNYLATSTLPIFGDFAKGGKYGQNNIVNMPFQDVARAIYPSFGGAADCLPAQPVIDEPYAHSVEMDLTKVTVEDSTCLVAVAMLIDAQTGFVVAADTKAVDFRGEATGIVSATNHQKLWPADIYDLKGRRVRRAAMGWNGLPKGVYVVGGKKIVK